MGFSRVTENLNEPANRKERSHLISATEHLTSASASAAEFALCERAKWFITNWELNDHNHNATQPNRKTKLNRVSQ